MKGNFKATSALALLSSNTVTTTQVKEFGDAVAKEFAEIPKTERLNAARAVLVGIGFHAVKASLKHGEFTPWLQSKVNQVYFWSAGTAKTNASYYMRLAIAFIEETKPGKAELLAIAAGHSLMPSAETSNAHAARLFERIGKFVGERSLNELLIEHGIKAGAGGGSSSKGSITAGEDPLFADTATHLMGLRALILDPEQIKRFSASQIKDIEVQLASALDEFRKLKAALRA